MFSGSWTVFCCMLLIQDVIINWTFTAKNTLFRKITNTCVGICLLILNIIHTLLSLFLQVGPECFQQLFNIYIEHETNMCRGRHNWTLSMHLVQISQKIFYRSNFLYNCFFMTLRLLIKNISTEELSLAVSQHTPIIMSMHYSGLTTVRKNSCWLHISKIKF